MTKEQALTLLQGLGDTAEKIAASLRTEGIVGFPQSSEYCPITLFLKKHGADYPATTSNKIILGVDELGDEIVMDTPASVARFVRLFDISIFPDLIKR